MTTHKKTSHHGRSQPAPKPVVLVTDAGLQAAGKLPLFGPGIVITIPLNSWPAYKALHHLELPGGYDPAFNILTVKRTPQEQA